MKKIIFFLFFISASFLSMAQSDTLQQYAGTYVFPEGSVVPTVEVKYDNGSLTMNSAAGTSSLTWLGIDSFSIVEFGGTAVFKRTDDRKISTVHIEAAGYVLDGKKQENGWPIDIGHFVVSRKEELLH